MNVLIQFCVSGLADSPEVLLKELGIEASKSWKAGDPLFPGVTISHTSHGFYMSSGDDDDDFQDRVERLIDRVVPLRDKLLEVNAQLELSCVFYLSGSERPVIHFSREVLAKIAHLGASIDADVYYLSDE